MKLKNKNDYDEFEKVFESMWRTSKDNGITRKDVEEEIYKERNMVY